MTKNLLLIQGHPDVSEPHLCHAQAASCVAGAEESGHVARQINIVEIDFPLFCGQQVWEEGIVPAGLKSAQDDIARVE